MTNLNSITKNKCDDRINFDSDEASNENNEDSEIMKEIELSLKRDQAENEKLPKEIVINGKKYTDISVRDVKLEDENTKQIEERMRQDQEENKNLPDKAVINGHEFTNIRVRDIQVEPRSHESDDNIKQIEERMRRDQEENANLPDKAVIDGHEFTNIRVRDININPINHEDENMKEIEESMRRDREENKNLPEKVVIDGQEFTNIRVREVNLEPKTCDSKPNRPPIKKWNYVYDRSVFYQPVNNSSTPTRIVRTVTKPIKLTVTLKDIGMEDFYQYSTEEELPKLNNNNKQHTKTKSSSRTAPKEGELPKLNKNKSTQKQVQEPDHDSAKNKSPRKNKEFVSTYDPSIFYIKERRNDSPTKPVRCFNDPIKLTVTLKDIGMDGFESPLP